VFRTTKCSSSGKLYKQFYGILSRTYISSLDTVRMCLILIVTRLLIYYRCMIKYRKAALTDFLMMNI